MTSPNETIHRQLLISVALAYVMWFSPDFNFSGKCLYQDLAVGSARISLRRTLVANSLYSGQENRTMLTSNKSKSEVPNCDARTNCVSGRFC